MRWALLALFVVPCLLISIPAALNLAHLAGHVTSHREELVATGVWLIVGNLAYLFLALFISHGLNRSVIKPLLELSDWARQFKSATVDPPPHIDRPDEIGGLARSVESLVTTLATTEAKFDRFQTHDPLTQLINKRTFNQQLEEAVNKALINQESLSLVLVNIDNFSDYNFLNGHADGDDLLLALSEIITELCGSETVVARHQGDEFAIILAHQGEEAADKLAKRIHREFGLLYHDESVSVSLGAASLDLDSGNPTGLILAAELALGQSKALGGNKVTVYEEKDHEDQSEIANPAMVTTYLQDGSLDMIQALAASVDAKDPYTKGHSLRVAEYAADLAMALEFDADQVDLIYRTGIIHDLGKIGIPDAILKKPSPLDDEERAVMKTHPVLGEVIVKKVPALEPTLPGIRHHHEEYSGSGYPDGLAGEQIPAVARILAIADTFDAMTSDRPYRKGLTWEVALELIEREAGTQFDPGYAIKFVELMRKRGNIAA